MNPILKFSLFLVFTGTPLLAHSNSITLAPIYLEVGEQRVIHTGPLEQFSVSGECIRHWRAGNSGQILVKANCPGVASLLIRTRAGSTIRQIRIEQRKQSPHPPELLRALNGLHTTEVIDSGPVFILRGRISDLPEAKTVARLRDLFPQAIVDETETDPDWIASCIDRLSKLIEPYPGLKLQHLDGEFLIQGSVSHETIANSIRKRVQTIQPLTRLEIQTLRGPDSTLY